jgi:hypothetical protein
MAQATLVDIQEAISGGSQEMSPRIYESWRDALRKAKVFRSKDSQAVRLPKELQLDAKEVSAYIRER